MGPANGPPSILSSSPSRVSLINDGSSDAAGIRVFNTLKGKGLPAGVTPVFWENIGSRIKFIFNGGPTPTVTLQPYPTYFEYRNGRHVITMPQAPTPAANFGTVPCTGLGGVTPGGRCGNASLPPAASARIPAYTLP
ncbi:MAG: hypothetical protein GKR87_07770 [Kiritimatiellae bacterium]|nr:hypothetical protein [Kiritimatiellia bacterium]